MKDTVLGLLAPLITELCDESLSSFYMVCLFRCLSNRHSLLSRSWRSPTRTRQTQSHMPIDRAGLTI